MAAAKKRRPIPRHVSDRRKKMESCELGCYGFDDVIMGGLDLMQACRDGFGLVIDGDLKTVFVVEDEE